jgi:hypothetical protein
MALRPGATGPCAYPINSSANVSIKENPMKTHISLTLSVMFLAFSQIAFASPSYEATFVPADYSGIPEYEDINPTNHENFQYINRGTLTLTAVEADDYVLDMRAVASSICDKMSADQPPLCMPAFMELINIEGMPMTSMTCEFDQPCFMGTQTQDDGTKVQIIIVDATKSTEKFKIFDADTEIYYATMGADDDEEPVLSHFFGTKLKALDQP